MPRLFSILARISVLLAWALGPALGMVHGAPEPARPNLVFSLDAQGQVSHPAALARMQAVANEGEPLRVLVRLRDVESVQARGSTAVAQAQRRAIAAAQDRLLAVLGASGPRQTRRYQHFPFLALRADRQTLDRLTRNPHLVAEVVEDQPIPLALSQSTVQVGAQSPEVWTSGFTGAGQTIAILDTGVASSHPHLAGKVVAEACFSTDDPGNAIYTSCPNGLERQTGVGAGAPCSSAVPGCDHGTHVAAIAASGDSTYPGVAKGANLIAIQVFTYFYSSEACGSPPCVKTYNSDYIAALDHVYGLRDSYNIASINMSIGGSSFTSACDLNPAKTAIDQLRAAGIATIIASGNNGYTNAISSPGCISSAISVGSVTKSDVVSSFSNSASFLSLLAPGSSITAAVPGGITGIKSGTSMATPHVAGAFAVLKGSRQNASVSELLAILQNTGTSILDGRNGITKQRINLKAAFVLGQAKNLSPSATVTTPTPTYTWDAVQGATAYYLWVNDSATSGKIKITYTASQAACATGTGTCSATPSTGLINGTARFWVQALFGSGAGLWSAERPFTVAVVTLTAPTLSSPSGSGIGSSPTYTWQAVAGSNWYKLLIYRNDSSYFEKWYTASEAGCPGGTGSCSVTPGQQQADGSYQWWVQGYNAGGEGPWSTKMSYQIGAAPLGAATLTAPSGTLSTPNPSFSWQAVSGSTWYKLLVYQGNNLIHEQWYTVADTGCAGGAGACAITPAFTHAPGSYKWWIQTYSPAGNGAWSTGMTYLAGVPAAATLTSPSGSAASSPSFSWPAVSGSNWYYLWINKGGAEFYKKWYTATEAGCAHGTGTCSIAPGQIHASGDYLWWIQTYNGFGYGPWSSSKSYTVP